jgi:hypothetical protein
MTLPQGEFHELKAMLCGDTQPVDRVGAFGEAGVGRGLASGAERRDPQSKDRRVVRPEVRAVALEGAHGLAEGLLERPAHRHDLTDGLHPRGEARVGVGKLLERPSRNLDHDVVERRLEARRRLSRDVVGDLVEPVADCELRGDLGDGETGGLAGQCG